MFDDTPTTHARKNRGQNERETKEPVVRIFERQNRDTENKPPQGDTAYKYREQPVRSPSQRVDLFVVELLAFNFCDQFSHDLLL